jgi:hypothetical protein
MQQAFLPMSRRRFVRTAGMTAVGILFGIAARAKERMRKTISLFDGKSLRGWKQNENSAASLSASQIPDPTAFVHEIEDGTGALSVFLRGQLEPAVGASLETYSATAENSRQVLSALVKNLNQIVAGPAIYDRARFGNGITLRPETRKLLRSNPRGYQLAELNKLLIEDAYPMFITKAALVGWTVKDEAMASLGTGRGVIYTDRDFSRFRLMFTMRHVSGKPDHQACVLIFCTRPQGDEKPLDALGGIQFQVPNGGHWDYRPGMNTAGGPEFTTVTKSKFDIHEWSRVEILADASQGTARMAVAQPPGSKGVEVLDFKNPEAGKVGPIAWQMHNAGLFDEYKDVRIEIDPAHDELITVA